MKKEKEPGKREKIPDFAKACYFFIVIMVVLIVVAHTQ